MADIQITVDDKQLKEFSKTLEKSYSTIKKINGALSTEAKTTKEVDEAMKRSISVQKEVNKNQLETNRILTKQNDVLIQSRLARQKATSDRKKEILANNAVNGSYNAINLALNKNIAAYKNLSARQRENVDVGGKLLKTIQRQDAALKKLDSQMGRNQRNVGNYAGALKNVATSLLGAFGVIGGIQLFAQVLRNAFKIVKEFQKANAELAGVLGKSRKEITFLTDDAERLGATTAFTAEEVTRLQIEYAKLGRTESEIVKLTEATINLSIATGRTAAEAAAFVGATLNQFNLTADETTRVVDVVGKSFSSSALDFEKLSTALAIVGPVASQFGQSLETTIAQLGILADRGIDASTSSTALRNIFLDLSGEGLTLEEGLSKIRNSSNQLITAFDLFGKRGASVATILANNTNNVDQLNDSLLNVDGTIKKLADEQLNTLDGSLKLLQSAWSGLILDIENGNGILGKIINSVIRFVTWILNAEQGVLKFVGSIKLLGGVPRAILDRIRGTTEDIGVTFEETARKTEGFAKEGTRLLTSFFDQLQDIDDLGEELEIIDAPLLAKKITGLGKLIGNNLPEETKKAAEKALTIEEQIFAAGERSIQQASLNGYKKYQEDLTAIAINEAEKRNLTTQQYGDLAKEVENGVTSFISASREKEYNQLISQKNAELAAAGDNADKRAEIEAKYAQKEIAIKQKIAKFDKAAKLLEIATSLAVNIFKIKAAAAVQLSLGNFAGAAIALSQIPFTIASSAIQAAIVAAQPIPQFDKGTKSTPDTFMAGEKRPEFVRYRDGKVELLTQPTLFTQSRGMEVISGRETDHILKGQKQYPFTFDDTRIVNELRSQNSKPIYRTEVTTEGIMSATRKGNTTVKQIKRF